MLYVQRDTGNRLLRVEAAPFEGMDGTLPADDQDIQAWYANQSLETSLLRLKQSDLEMIRVLEDLIQTLMDKGVIRLTDLPAAAQAKLSSRTQARDALSGLYTLLDEEENGIL